MTFSGFEIAMLLGVAYVAVMPLASIAASDVWWGQIYWKERAWVTVLWPVCVVMLWAAMAIYFPLAWLRRLVIWATKPLAIAGKLPAWSLPPLRWIVRNLPD